MNTKVIVYYTKKDGTKGEVSEYHTNNNAASNAVLSICKGLGYGVTITGAEFLPVVKHIELAPIGPLSQTDINYSKVK
jgi:hypothetical protein